jgi:enoyl-CoA hydratase
MSEPEVLVDRRGYAGCLTLNRPKALNALNLGMVRAIAAALDEGENDATVTRVIVTGAGGRAFCAGGDIRLLYEQGRANDHAAQLTFWREEYRLNRRIKRYPKPYVALVDGIVMGGGVGVSAHGARLIASERFAFAMPEVGIGFFPDVGATYLLPRLPNHTGAYLALTALRANAGDAVALGLAQAMAPSARMNELAAALESGAPIDSTISQFAAAPPSSALAAQGHLLESCFRLGNAAQIVAALKQAVDAGSEFASAALAAMLGKSPTSQAIALRQMQAGLSLSFEEAMALEFRIVSRICHGHDFYEGVRALIIEKDNQPQWRPAAGEEGSDDAVAAYFAPLGASELSFAAAES